MTSTAPTAAAVDALAAASASVMPVPAAAAIADTQADDPLAGLEGLF
jgi:hypothetical protein